MRVIGIEFAPRRAREALRGWAGWLVLGRAWWALCGWAGWLVLRRSGAILGPGRSGSHVGTRLGSASRVVWCGGSRCGRQDQASDARSPSGRPPRSARSTRPQPCRRPSACARGTRGCRPRSGRSSTRAVSAQAAQPCAAEVQPASAPGAQVQRASAPGALAHAASARAASAPVTPGLLARKQLRLTQPHHHVSRAGRSSPRRPPVPVRRCGAWPESASAPPPAAGARAHGRARGEGRTRAQSTARRWAP